MTRLASLIAKVAVFVASAAPLCGSSASAEPFIPCVRIRFEFGENIPPDLKPKVPQVKAHVAQAVETAAARYLTAEHPYIDWLDSQADDAGRRHVGEIVIVLAGTGGLNPTIHLSAVATSKNRARPFASSNFAAYDAREFFEGGTDDQVAKDVAKRALRELKNCLAHAWREEFTKALIVAEEIEVDGAIKRVNVAMSQNRLNAVSKTKLGLKFKNRVADEDVEGWADLTPIAVENAEHQRCKVALLTISDETVYDGRATADFSQVIQHIPRNVWKKVQVYVMNYVPVDEPIASDPN